MQGKIVKGIAGFYYVHVVEFGIYECKAKGIFRKKGTKPLVGDNVEIDILDEETKLGNIREILPRKNELIRPAVANIDQALVGLDLKLFPGILVLVGGPQDGDDFLLRRQRNRPGHLRARALRRLHNLRGRLVD